MVSPIDGRQADRFLQLLGKSPATARLRGFPHRLNPYKYHPKTRPHGIRARKGRYDLAAAHRWQEAGCGVYLVINNGGDKAAEITSCRAFFVEWDNRPIEWQLTAWHLLGLGEPTIIVATGGKSAHCYWVLREPIPPDQWAPIQSALIEFAGGDCACKDASRVMRLPGAHYIGPDGKPTGETATIVHESTCLYSPEEVEQWILPDEFGQPDPPRSSSSSPQSSSSSPQSDPGSINARPIEQIRDALAAIPRRSSGSNTYPDYRNILWGLIKACEAAGADIDTAIDLMEAHSPSTESGWDISQVARSGGDHIAAATFWWHARQHGWRPPARAKADQQQPRDRPPHDDQPAGDQQRAQGGPDSAPPEPSREEQIQSLLDELLDLLLDASDPWAAQQARRAELWNLGVRGDAIDDRLLYALANRWELPLQVGHAGTARGRLITDPLDNPAEDLIPGFLLWRRDHVVFGAGGAGKTIAAAAMGAAIIKGTSFLDQQIPPPRTGRILWIGSDGGEGARAMVAEYLEDLGVADDPAIVNGFTIWAAEASDNLPPWSCTPRGLLELREELERGGYALVVIDSLKAVLELAGINFGIGPVGTLMRFMQALVGRHCSLLWLHHPAGGKAAGKGLQAAAGSQNINQIPSGVHQISRLPSDRGPVNEWSVHKLRGSQSREFSYRLTEDGFEVTRGEITGNARAEIIDAIHTRTQMQMPCQTSLLVSELFGFNESTVRNNLTWLRKRRLIRKTGTAWRLTKSGRAAWEAINAGSPIAWT
jgi:hypothetical protein